MGRLKQKGKAGAAKAYVTRTAAVKKLQCSLADFRRLCILKGIFPREPRNKKKANKGSTVPTSFYYAKDIAYLAHEPVLNKLREHKAFAKKISRALGRGEWSTAKHLEDQKPSYRLDHVIKERYPTFVDAVRDIDDALCMVFLFATLPANERISSSLVANCSRLAAEWQLYIMHSRSLRKVFLSVKGIYYQAEVMDESVTWLVPYQFTQNIPTDVDVRVMLTFLELYQTLLGFVFFKLYTDAGLVYPPALDTSRDDAGAGIGSFTLRPADPAHAIPPKSENTAKKASSKEVRQAIKHIVSDTSTAEHDTSMATVVDDGQIIEADEEFVPQLSTSESGAVASLPTLQSLSAMPRSDSSMLFAPYTFFLSREVSRPVFEFLIRSFGGRVGWPPSSGNGSPFTESEETITHVITDRPIVTGAGGSQEEKERRRRRRYVQPQWVADCINAGKIILENLYSQGATLPPHLSPFDAKPGAYDPMAPLSEDEEEAIPVDDADGEADEEAEGQPEIGKTLSTDVDDADDLRAAELAAEVAGVDYEEMQRGAHKIQKVHKTAERENETDMAKMLLSKKKRKLYESMKLSQRKRVAEHDALKEKRRKIEREKRRSG